MSRFAVKYRENLEKFFKPPVWWSLWTVSALYYIYMICYNGVLLIINNYYLPGMIALKDGEIGRLFFIALYIPLTSFTSLFTGHITLAFYKVNRLKRV